jgi:lysozyme
MSNDLVVVDASHWQAGANPNWQKAIDAGIVGLLFKATEGTGYTDPTFKSRYAGAIKAGLAVGSYHFLRHGNVKSQMNLYLNAVAPRNGELMVLDWEDAAVTVSEVEECVAYLKTDSRNLHIVIYGSSSFLRDRVKKGSPIASGTDLWVASYTSAAQPSSWGDAWPAWSLWQYTDKATVAGYGPLDGNRYAGSRAECAAWIGPAAGAQPEPPVTPEPPLPQDEIIVSVDIQAPEGVKVRVIVNNQSEPT